MCFHHLTKWLGLFIATLLIFSTASYAADAHIAVSAFTTTANKHKPSNTIQQLDNDVKKIYFFTDLRNFQGQTLTHQWSYNGWVAQSIPFEIKANRWRVSSNKSLKPRGKGTWTVTILNEAGKIIQKNTISYNKNPTHVAQSEIKNSEKENKKEVKKETKQSTTPKIDEIQKVSKKLSKTTVEKKENTEESTQKTASKKENSTTKTATNSKDKEIAKAEKTEAITKVEKSEEVATKKNKNETTTNSKKVVTQDNSQTAEVNSSTSTVKTVIGNDSSEKSAVDHIGDCDDDDQETESTGKQQFRDE